MPGGSAQLLDWTLLRHMHGAMTLTVKRPHLSQISYARALDDPDHVR